MALATLLTTPAIARTAVYGAQSGAQAYKYSRTLNYKSIKILFILQGYPLCMSGDTWLNK
ncbi:hypothetical protein BH23CYA1_BH23CYA1_05700 [soil metagenome]